MNESSNLLGREHFYIQKFNTAIKKSTTESKVYKEVTSHTFRHTFANQLLESGCDLRTIPTLLGHKNIQTTMIYTRVASSCYARVTSPFDWIMN